MMKNLRSEQVKRDADAAADQSNTYIVYVAFSGNTKIDQLEI